MLNEEFYAYGSNHIGIEAIMRFHAVKRWHMIDTTRVQTLAEHSANVALLVFYIARTCPDMFFGPAEPAAAAALVHDLEEVFTGDIPSHTKKRLTGIKELEVSVLPALFKCDTWDNLNHLIKLCDLADGIRFIRLHGVDVTSMHAREGIESQYATKREAVKKHWPKEVYNKVYKDTHFYAYERS